jgi:PPOX class probable F420-dependent enzyme
VARLATVDSDGSPHLVPICFVLSGATVYTAVDRKPKRSTRLRRLENIRANPGVEVLVDHYQEEWSGLWWARLRGRGRIVERGDEHDRALELLATKYPQYRDDPPPGPVLAVDVERWSTWRASEAPDDRPGGRPSGASC